LTVKVFRIRTMIDVLCRNYRNAKIFRMLCNAPFLIPGRDLKRDNIERDTLHKLILPIQ
jgi:hypothetical protein